MCRWLAYSGEPLKPSLVILDAKNSLVAQSLNSPLGAETVNGDGFGVGWYPTDGMGSKPAIFHSTEPAWNDTNLRELTTTITSPLFFSHVRAAAGPPIQQSNCHPFRYGHWLFMHNGAIADFGMIKRDLTFAVDPSLYPEIIGTTDSEVLFYLALSLGLQDDPIAGLGAAIQTVEKVGREAGIAFPMQGTVAISDGSTIWAVRYSSAGRSRSLFHSVDAPIVREMYPDMKQFEEFGDKAQLVVSEPLNDLPGVFKEVPESTAVILNDGSYEHHPFLDDPSRD
ncbi:class II glutamine amidotransferase [Planctomonas sp. JC2975]|uniref:class II glutamine amidotransferase n=1 Tax=Planctomonas sp. JC2975 TaxID=2729626 RepID=UPI0014743268|nr:class II glutamine amidotransferase [Planctomonas sp. JC2975]NNC11628.1 class II glutamine amidotransferase [Planctomonas sp. JC2975]